MKLALVVPSLLDGGGVPAVARFVKDAALASGDCELRVVSLAMSSRDPCNVCLTRPASWLRGVGFTPGEWEGLPVRHVGAVLGEFEFQRYRPRAALARALAGCDAIQVVAGSPAWANAVFGLGAPVSIHVATRALVERRRRDADPHGALARWRRAMTRVTDRLDDLALQRADAIQVMNPAMLAHAHGLVGERGIDIRLAPPGVDAAYFRPMDERRPGDGPTILCVGRLADPRKNIELLLEAFAVLRTLVDAATRLVLAGSSAPPARFWRRVEDLGIGEQVHFFERPDRATLARLYRTASVFALPSDEEGFGMVLLEAMASGVPVVATRCGGPEGIVTDAEDGFLVPRGDAAAMARRLALLLSDPQRNVAMGRSARSTVERRFEQRIAAATFVDVWQRLARAPGGTTHARA
ncbi:glycosyltransferase [Dokdonella sp.]|uniref:glycosyltransferase n=1 Tax=Dokdonella sp. TaxID=2291710 RepID=UPI002F3E6F60